MEPKEAFDEKIKFFNEAERKLAKLADRIQNTIWRTIQPLLNLFDDRIEPDDATVRQINKLNNETFREYKDQTVRVANQVEKDFNRINGLNDMFYINYRDSNPEGYASGKSYSEVLLIERLGLAPNGFSKEGFLSNFIGNPEVLEDIKLQTFQALTSGISKEALTHRLENLILGTDSSSGVSQAQINTYLTDAYNDFDSLTQKVRADRLGMRVAIYANSIIQDSRCFCREHFNQAWTVEEISKFQASTKPSETKSGANCKAIYKTTQYDPFVHRGGYNCRHVYRYVPKRTAIRFRPELEEYYEDLDDRGVSYL